MKDKKVLKINKLNKTYSKNGLDKFGNQYIYKFITELESFNSEADLQIKEYRESGFDGLKNFLINTVEFN